MTDIFSKIISFLAGDIVFLLVALIIIYGGIVLFGRGRIISTIIAFYPALLLYNTFPFKEQVLILQGENLLLLNQVIIFFIFLLPLSIIINRYIFSPSEYGKKSNLWKNLGVSLVALVLFLIFTQSIVNLDILHDFSPRMDSFFANPNYVFYWNLLPFLLLAFL